MLRTGDGTNGRRFIEGSGTPEGAVTGSIGDIFSDIAGGAGTTFYVKESGNATNTGWVAVGTEDHKVMVEAADLLAEYLYDKVATANGLVATTFDKGAGVEAVRIGADDILLPDTGAIIRIGPDATTGSWRLSISGTDLIAERYETSAWIEKGAFTAA